MVEDRGGRRAASRLLAATLLPLAGCYYTHLATGQMHMLLARQPIEELLAAPETPADLAGRLRPAEGGGGAAGRVRLFSLRRRRRRPTRRGSASPSRCRPSRPASGSRSANSTPASSTG